MPVLLGLELFLQNVEFFKRLKTRPIRTVNCKQLWVVGLMNFMVIMKNMVNTVKNGRLIGVPIGQGWPNHCLGAKKCLPRNF